jgi:hypothetical protein
MARIIEIRSYQLKPGTAERFDRLMREESLPLLERAGTAVLAARPSLHAGDAYVLMRAYRDTRHRTESQQEFYSSDAWLKGPCTAIMECIATYTTAVLEADIFESLNKLENKMNRSELPDDGRRDFDFLLGDWKVTNRRLRKRLQGCDEWESFEAWQTNRSLPGGIGNYDDFVAATWRPDYVGMSLRLFNPQTRQWSIHWLDNQNGGLNPAGTLLPPVVGTFDKGVGIFEGDDTLDDQPIRVRYIWSGVGTDTPRWEQEMSGDAGRTWEKNWVMDFEPAARPENSMRP